jgi:hypothetical protein
MMLCEWNTGKVGVVGGNGIREMVHQQGLVGFNFITRLFLKVLNESTLAEPNDGVRF